MTTVMFERQEGGCITGFTCMGHAGYAKKRMFGREPDILCAAISALSMHTVNGLTEKCGAKCDITSNEEDGFLRCILVTEPDEKTQLLMDTFLMSLEQLSESYGRQYLTVQIKEV